MEQAQSVKCGESAELDLSAAERVVKLNVGGRIYRHVFKRIEQREWEQYARGAGAVLMQEGNAIIPQGGDEEAAWEFWGRNVVRVEGYTSAQIAEQGAGWKEFVPATHQLWAVEMLREVFAVEVSDDGEHTLVRIEANWNERVFEQLVHRFAQPSKAQVLRYRRTGARFLRVGGSRKQQTQIVIPSRLDELCKLYDELCVAVDGYASGDRLIEGASDLKSVDALHKSTAVNALFDPRGIQPPESATAGERR